MRSTPCQLGGNWISWPVSLSGLTMARAFVAGFDGGEPYGAMMTDRKDLPAGGYFVMPRYLPLAVIAILVAWTAGGIWWTAKLDARVATLEIQAERVEQAAEQRMLERDRLTIVEQQVKAIRESQDRQSAALDRIERRLGAWPPNAR